MWICFWIGCNIGYLAHEKRLSKIVSRNPLTYDADDLSTFAAFGCISILILCIPFVSDIVAIGTRDHKCKATQTKLVQSQPHAQYQSQSSTTSVKTGGNQSQSQSQSKIKMPTVSLAEFKNNVYKIKNPYVILIGITYYR